MVRRGTGRADLDCWLYDGAGRLVAEDVGTDGFCVLPAAGIGLHRVVARTLDSAGVEYMICTTSDVLDTRRDPPSAEGDRRSGPNAGEHQPSTGWSR
jgi:hypothetical protein